ncbi:cobaltochelatase subunit CobN [Methyloceanibacter caenitepidi]|uniref:CobN component of cobalt chelatase n=1 Tax=Methyloceanibacter caenitepidi TaxID=1384459 RepID=A0A0A8JYM1_9HYPH|nr:cobaltochelatase subunit CobN [Methyloceanibacter caenitepidi]BAQ15873.1 CobN component of cobalt chelatase [Methyloceanibacter caenitepidi]
MHLLQTSSATLDDIAEPIDLGQTPGDIAVLSFTDSDLSGLAAAYADEREQVPSVRLAHLRDLRHPMSTDLWIDTVAQHAKVIVVRLLGGLDWWRYGVERLSAVARERGIALAVLPGEDRDDPRLFELSTLDEAELQTLLAYFREGGAANLRALLRRLARLGGAAIEAPPPHTFPRMGAYRPGTGVTDIDAQLAPGPEQEATVPILFYRASLLAADTGPIDALCDALAARGLNPVPLFVPSLKAPDAIAFVREAFGRLDPSVIVTTTAFAAGDGVFDGCDAPVLQAIVANTRREAWASNPRGLGPSDLSMHVVLPELDGRVLAGTLGFKDKRDKDDALGFEGFVSKPEPDRIEAVGDKIAKLARLRHMPRADRKLAIVLPDYPGAGGRAAYAVGLDVPASVLAVLSDLEDAGYTVEGVPEDSRTLLARLTDPAGGLCLSLERYERLVSALPESVVATVREAWGRPEEDPDFRDGAFRYKAARFGKLVAALPPDRGKTTDRRADYHDPVLPPRHALLAFGLWMQHEIGADAVLHLGAHGTLEWLPGHAVALTASCSPEAVLGTLPVFYPFIVSNPGEAAQAKRRVAAVTIGHLPPPLTGTEMSGAALELEQLVDEYAIADGLDTRRRDRLAGLIVDKAKETGLAAEAGLAQGECEQEALRKIDTWLCDLKDLAVKDGLHVFGRDAYTDDAHWLACAETERAALLDALDGKRVKPGPAGAPARGRRDVLPTGRNLYTADPRVLPTQTAMELGARAASEIVRGYMQEHGEMPRSLVIDLWGSSTLRTGGEEIAQGLALMGCRPVWDPATGRVTGVEVLPPASMGRPRVDVTFRISGLFRDLFPAQIALLDAAVKLVAARDEEAEENPLAAAVKEAGAEAPERIFGSAPGAYGAGIEDLLGSESAEPVSDEALSAAYLAATSHVYGGAEGTGTARRGAFANRVASADLLVHISDDPTRDILEGAEDVAHMGGFAAAARALGASPDLVVLDTTNPDAPRARPLPQALARIVRARAISPAFIEGMMRHGARGAAELAETVDRLADFAEITDAVSDSLFDAIHDAYLADTAVRDFLIRENLPAARAIATRLDDARRKGLWHPKRNDLYTDALLGFAEAAQ